MPRGATGYVEMQAAAGFEGALAGSFVFAETFAPLRHQNGRASAKTL